MSEARTESPCGNIINVRGGSVGYHVSKDIILRGHAANGRTNLLAILSHLDLVQLVIHPEVILYYFSAFENHLACPRHSSRFHAPSSLNDPLIWGRAGRESKAVSDVLPTFPLQSHTLLELTK